MRAGGGREGQGWGRRKIKSKAHYRRSRKVKGCYRRKGKANGCCREKDAQRVLQEKNGKGSRKEKGYGVHIMPQKTA